ncbi:MAG: carboxypeptidase regulatory-like domain-containing protein [Candidatus Andersenbacteria bacterium]|nr:carboxypeptidase regulatory-like domain-containing protein [Candidatus Andersenbacteria bacterium]
MSSKSGFTLLEVVIAGFVLGTVVVGIFSMITLTLKASHDGQLRIIATGLANEKMEQIRNLPYASVGTVGGIPSGSIPQTQQVTRNGQTFTVATDIRYIDDSYDGTATSNPPDTVNTDYKQARVEVTWASSLPSRSVLLIAQVAPSGIEGGDSLGTLVFQALNSAGTGVDSATVQLTNSSVTPTVNLTTYTNSSGQVVIPGLPVSSGTYQLTVSKSGYTTEQTYASSANFTPDADHSRLNAIAGSVTNKTFAIDASSKLTIKTVDQNGAALGSVPFSITGTKKIGTDATAQPVYLFSHNDTTDSGGSIAYQNMTWDSYALSVDGTATGYDISDTSVPVPLVLKPGDDTTLTVTLMPHQALSAHITVVNASGQSVSGVAVEVVKNGFDVTKQTGATGQVFLNTMTQSGDYAVTATASGYQVYTGTITVDGNVNSTIQLAGS